MKLSISNIAWDTSIDNDVADLLQHRNVHNIDIAPGKYFFDFKKLSDPEIKAVKKWWSDRNITICGMQSLLYGTQCLNIFNKNCQKSMLEHLKRVCHIGGVLNANKLVFGSPRNRDLSIVAPELAEDIALNFFNRLGDIAISEGVVICLEANPTCYGTNWITTTLEALEFVTKLNHRGIGVQLDLGTVYTNNESLEELLLKGSKSFSHIHLSEMKMAPVINTDDAHVQTGYAFAKAANDNAFTVDIASIEMLTAHLSEKNSTLQIIDSAIGCARSLYGIKEG